MLIRCVCSNCRRKFFVAYPAVAARRRFCSRGCYLAKPRQGQGPAASLVKALGGYAEVAERLGLTVRTVRYWNQRGVPTKHHFELLGFAMARSVSDIVTIEALRETNLYAHNERLRRSARNRPRMTRKQLHVG